MSLLKIASVACIALTLGACQSLFQPSYKAPLETLRDTAETIKPGCTAADCPLVNIDTVRFPGEPQLDGIIEKRLLQMTRTEKNAPVAPTLAAYREQFLASAGPRNSSYLQAKVREQHDGLVIIEVSSYLDTGGAHGTPGRGFINYSRQQHKVLNLSDMLMPGQEEAFWKAEAAERLAAGVPPYGRMAGIILSGPDVAQVFDIGAELAQHRGAERTGQQLAKIAARCMAGKTLAGQGATKEIVPDYYSVKEAIFPFAKFQGVDPILGPEMRSTGEVMGVGRTFAEAFGRAEEAANIKAPMPGKAFLSVRDPDKQRLLPVARELVERGYTLVATEGTAQFLRGQDIACDRVNKVIEGRPHIVDLIKNGEICYIVNTTEGKQAIADSFSIRREALQHRVTYSTTIPGARALIRGTDTRDNPRVWSLQELHKELHG